MKKLTFGKVFWIWFFVDLIQLFINGATIQHSLLAQCFHASIGVFLLFFPLYPKQFAFHWDDRKSKRIIRTIAAAQILFSFLIRINF